MADESIAVEVAYAEPVRQWLVELEVPLGTTAGEAVRRSVDRGLLPLIDVDRCKLGVFSRIVAPERRLQSGDRVEIYRPLKADPKDVRRALAAAGKTMGRAPPKRG